MFIKTDSEGKAIIESLCHIAMVNTSRADFLQNMAVISNVLLKMEVLPVDQPTDPPTPDPTSATK